MESRKDKGAATTGEAVKQEPSQPNTGYERSMQEAGLHGVLVFLGNVLAVKLVLRAMLWPSPKLFTP